MCPSLMRQSLFCGHGESSADSEAQAATAHLIRLI